MDRKGRTMQLSIKARDEVDAPEPMSEYGHSSAADASSGMTKLGALLREQLNNKSE